MSDIQKCPNLVRGRGVNIFKKCLKFKNVQNVGGGGGDNPNWDIVPNFLVFFSDASPYSCRSKVKISQNRLDTARKPQIPLY